MSDLLYGRNAVYETLRAGRRRCLRLWLASGAQETGTLADSIALANQNNIPIERVDRSVLDRQARHTNHQGVMLQASSYPYAELEDCLQLAAASHELPLLLILDHLQDPQNMGTLLRTAEVVGVHGVILPGRRTATITPAVVNTSSGATEHLSVVQAGNLAQTIAELQQLGMQVVGLENDSRAQEFDQVNLAIPLALVVGAEGTGLARLTRERCDFLIRLPMRGQIGSLNAATAGSIALYHTWRCRTQPAYPQ